MITKYVVVSMLNRNDMAFFIFSKPVMCVYVRERSHEGHFTCFIFRLCTQWMLTRKILNQTSSLLNIWAQKSTLSFLSAVRTNFNADAARLIHTMKLKSCKRN